MDQEIIEVNMAESKVAKSPAVMVSRGLGSCLAIIIYDPARKVGAMAHTMLPDIEKSRIKTNPARFVNSVVPNMLDDMAKLGAHINKNNLVAKIFGGAHMFTFIDANNPFSVGDRNIDMAKNVLNQHGIHIVAEDVGGNFGRTVEFFLETGKVRVRTISLKEKEF